MSSSPPDGPKRLAAPPDAPASDDSLAPNECEGHDEAVKTFFVEVDAGHEPAPTTAPTRAPTTPSTSNHGRESTGRERLASGNVPPLSTGQGPVNSPGSAAQSPATTASKHPATNQPASGVVDKAPAKKSKPAPNRTATRRPLQPASSPAPTEPRLRVASDPDEPDAARRLRSKTPSWLASVLVHALLFLLLSFFTLANLQRQDDLGLVSASPVAEEIEEFTDVELDAEDFDELADDMPLEAVDPGEAALGELATDEVLSNVASDLGAEASALGELGSLFGDDGVGMAQLGDGQGAAGAATFFGAEVEGNRIVFLVDNSGGMQNGALEALIAELLKTVAALTPKQNFYVIFYSDTVYPLFFPQPANDFVRPTPPTRELLEQWLDTVEVSLGNAVDEGLAAATSINPDVMYFLTDGRVNTTKDGRKLKMFLDDGGRNFVIHTYGMGTGDEGTAAEQLQQIAAANGGDFRAIEITAEHRRRAREKNRPYHNRQPGPVWGYRVKPPR